ncbi:ABC transporter [Phytophthora megakarya]|uniref:ABC transporter n=1 Tax=Phytophthora megakarya TaxID=4795 RepID=A0A225VJL4_9STRA|nr:ABC transporter [Phytophthora megakarya]
MSGSEPESQVPGGKLISPPVDVEWHESWEAFSAHMEEYYKRTHQIFRQRTSTSVTKRNREITIIPENFVNFWTKLVCTHGWSRKSRNKGIRTDYFDRHTCCKANIKADVSWKDAEKKFKIRVTDSCVTHNHQVMFDNHASNRRVHDPSVVLRGVHNMVTRMRELRRGGVSVEMRLEIVMRDYFKTRAKRAAVSVDDANTAKTGTLQTRQMRRWFKSIPEVLLIDSTHNTDESRYKLFSFMVNDVFGHVVKQNP